MSISHTFLMVSAFLFFLFIPDIPPSLIPVSNAFFENYLPFSVILTRCDASQYPLNSPYRNACSSGSRDGTYTLVLSDSFLICDLCAPFITLCPRPTTVSWLGYRLEGFVGFHSTASFNMLHLDFPFSCFYYCRGRSNDRQPRS